MPEVRTEAASGEMRVAGTRAMMRSSARREPGSSGAPAGKNTCRTRPAGERTMWIRSSPSGGAAAEEHAAARVSPICASVAESGDQPRRESAASGTATSGGRRTTAMARGVAGVAAGRSPPSICGGSMAAGGAAGTRRRASRSARSKGAGDDDGSAGIIPGSDSSAGSAPAPPGAAKGRKPGNDGETPASAPASGGFTTRHVRDGVRVANDRGNGSAAQTPRTIASTGRAISSSRSERRTEWLKRETTGGGAEAESRRRRVASRRDRRLERERSADGDVQVLPLGEVAGGDVDGELVGDKESELAPHHGLQLLVGNLARLAVVV